MPVEGRPGCLSLWDVATLLTLLVPLPVALCLFYEESEVMNFWLNFVFVIGWGLALKPGRASTGWMGFLNKRRRFARARINGLDQSLVSPVVRAVLNCLGLDDFAEKHFKHGSPFFEWWFVLVFFLTTTLFHAFRTIVFSDYFGMDLLLGNFDVTVTARFAEIRSRDGLFLTFDNETMHSKQELMHALSMPRWLKGLAMAAPCVGVVAAVVFLVHFSTFVFFWKTEKAKGFLVGDAVLDISGDDTPCGISGDDTPCGVVVQVGDIGDMGDYKVIFDDAQEFDVDIGRTTGQSPGLSLTGGPTLNVLAVSSGGLVQQWNERQPETARGRPRLATERATASSSKVKPGHFIVEVNGIRNDIPRMLDELSREQETTTLKMKVKRSQSKWLNKDAVKSAWQNPWVADRQEEMAFLVVMMPFAFLALGMTCLLHVLNVMTGTGLAEHPNQIWRDFEQPHMCTAQADLEVAALTQYFVVGAFGMLCTYFFGWGDMTTKIINIPVLAEKLTSEISNNVELHGQLLQKLKDELDEANRNAFQERSKEHRRTFSIVGLLGVWGYVAIGILRSLTNFVFLVARQFQGHRRWAMEWQVMITQYVQPALLVSMAFCVINMIVVLQMRELRTRKAFGSQAAKKFVICRFLLILADLQPMVLSSSGKYLPDGWGLSSYQVQLTHASLLMFECFGLILFNSMQWTSTVQRAEDNVVRRVSPSKRRPSAAEVRSALRSGARTSEAWLAGVLPFFLMVLTLVTATAGVGGAGAQHLHTFGVTHCFDILLRWFGNWLCLPVLFCRVGALGVRPEFLEEARGSGIRWFPWALRSLVVWLVMFAFRLTAFLFLHPFTFEFSNRIFLLTSMIVMIQMELVIAHVAGWKAGWKVMIVAWILLLLLYLDAFRSAHYFEEEKTAAEAAAAVWSSFGAGSLFFLPPAVWWFHLVLSSRRDGADDGSRVPLTSSGH